MIESVTWVNIHNGETINFNADDTPFQTFTTEIELRQDQIDKPQEHGSVPGFPYLGVRTFHAEGEILEDTAGSYIGKRRRMVRSLLPSARYNNKVIGTLEIRFTGFSEKIQSLCSLDGWPELPMEALGPAHGAYQINWKAYDPRLYGIGLQSDTTAIAGVTAVGRQYPKDYPYSYIAGGGISGDLTLTNDGDIDTYPLVAISGPAVYPALSLLSPGTPRTIEFGNLVVDEGEVITVDFENREATSSKGRDVYYTLTKREWWALDVGDSVVRFSAYAAEFPAQATFSWRNAYML